MQNQDALTGWEEAGGDYWRLAEAAMVPDLSAQMIAQGARLVTMSGLACAGGESEVLYHWALGRRMYNLRARTQCQQLPSITPLTPAADWIEREIHDLYGVVFNGHPHLERLIRPAQLPEGFFRD